MRCRKCRAYVYEGMEKCPECGVLSPCRATVFDYIARAEEILLSCTLSAMILLVLAQIILRNFFSMGIMGSSEMVRHLVLWVAFLGAGLAARDGKHIRIEIAGHILPGNLQRVFAILTSLFSVCVCSILVYASLSFVGVDYHGGGTIPFLDIPLWCLQVIIPAGYCVITLRFAMQCMENVHALIRGD